MKRLLAYVVGMASLALFAAVPLITETVNVCVDRTDSWQLSMNHGETRRVDIVLSRSDGTPWKVDDTCLAQFYWQTNGMGTAWWKRDAIAPTNGVASFDWYGSMDTGADKVTAFLSVMDSASNRLYAANGFIRLQYSPGYEPNALPLPVTEIDFALVTVTNAPWPTMEEMDTAIATATNAIPQPDMSAYVKKSGDTMTGILTVPTLSILSGGNQSHYGAQGITCLTPNGAETLVYPEKTGTFALLSDIEPSNPSFSNAVLAVGLNIDTNSIAALNKIASAFGGFPVGGVATTVGGLLAALAAAVAWLRAGKADKVTGATAGNFAALDAAGNLVDSGRKPSDIPAVVAPSTAASDAGKAADAKATGDALARKFDAVNPEYPSSVTPSKLQWGDDGLLYIWGPQGVIKLPLNAYSSIETLATQEWVNALPGPVLPDAETWTFEVDDGQGGTATVTKRVAVYPAQQGA